MAGMSSYLQNKLVDHIFRGTSYTAPSQIYAGLLSANPANDAATGTEVTGTDYARATPGANSQANWIATQDTPGDTGSAAASSATTGRTANGAEIDFGTVGSGGWDSATGVALYDASTGGNMLFWVALGSTQSLPEGATVSYAAGDLTITLD